MNAENNQKKGVKLTNIVKRFEEVSAVDGVSIDIPAGEFCTLLGPSGSGKTTLLKVIAGYEKPTEGTVRIGGRDVSDVSVAKRNIGMVFQNYALFPHMTVTRNIAFPLEMRHRPPTEINERVNEALALVDLADLGDRRPRELSGGQQQRVALARALVFDPDILLMDEPLGALDKNLRQSMQSELKKLHRRVGVTVVYVTHDQEEALYLSDRIVVFNNGKVAQAGAPENLYNAPKTAFVASFLGECNLIPACLEITETGKRANIGGGQSMALPEKSPEQTISMIGIRPERFAVAEEARSLENKFMARVEEIYFLGQGYKIIASAYDHQWSIVTQNRLDLPRPAIGDEIEMGFSAEDIIII